jgi:C-terminal processing protease CtpA/Prc
VSTFRALALPLFLATVCSAQLTLDQKVNDFEHLAALYAKQYGPYEWKKELQAFDLLDLTPWLSKVRASKDDLEFYDVMSEYVASLNDAHDGYFLPSSFVARLHFAVDIYDGKVLIDSINRTRLPANEFPFQIGDELVSLDGRSAEEWISELTRYNIAANPLSTRRLTAGLITIRPQQIIPRAIEVGPFATVVTRNEYGHTSTHFVPWAKTGLPLLRVGPVPSPKESSTRHSAAEAAADYMAPLLQLQNAALPPREAVLGFGSLSPIFNLPPEYTPRLPRTPGDFFTSGTIRSGGRRIGFIRIPSYGPSNANAAVQQFRQEIAFFQQNTDGLIVDQMRNPGGQVGYVNALLQLLIPNSFRTIGFEIRATSNWIIAISSALESARAQNAPEHVILLMERILSDLDTANRENRGRTGPLPVDDVSLDRLPATDTAGRVVAYTKPLMVLIDEMSASGADMFPATIQDNGRGVLFGMRTMGAGGNVVTVNVGNYTEGLASITQSLMVRSAPVNVNGYPSVPYIENVGVHPDIVQDYMTRDNLMQGGRAFVDAMLAAMIEQIGRNER